MYWSVYLTRCYIQIDNLHFFEIWRHIDDTLVEAVVCEWRTGKTNSDTDDTLMTHWWKLLCVSGGLEGQTVTQMTHWWHIGGSCCVWVEDCKDKQWHRWHIDDTLMTHWWKLLCVSGDCKEKQWHRWLNGYHWDYKSESETSCCWSYNALCKKGHKRPHKLEMLNWCSNKQCVTS